MLSIFVFVFKKNFFFLGIFSSDREDWKTAAKLYRGPGLLVEFLFFMGVNVYGWRSSGVNHVLIFELDPRNHLSEQHIMELAAIFGVIWCLSVLCFIFSSSLAIPPYVNPLALITVMALFLLNPTKTFRHEARFWVLRVLVSNNVFLHSLILNKVHVLIVVTLRSILV